MHMLQSLFCLTIALLVLGVTITHLQEHKTTVTTASGSRYTVLLFCAPEDGWWWRSKHVEQLSDKINSVTCASCWDLYIRILLRCTDPWTLNIKSTVACFEILSENLWRDRIKPQNSVLFEILYLKKLNQLMVMLNNILLNLFTDIK